MFSINFNIPFSKSFISCVCGGHFLVFNLNLLSIVSSTHVLFFCSCFYWCYPHRRSKLSTSFVSAVVLTFKNSTHLSVRNFLKMHFYLHKLIQTSIPDFGVTIMLSRRHFPKVLQFPSSRKNLSLLIR